MLLATLNSVAAMVRKLAVALDQAVALGVGLEMIRPPRRTRCPCLSGQHFADAAAELGMGVDAGAHGRAADGQFQQRLDCASPARPDRALQLPGQAADLLAQRKRRGVGQVRAADLEDVLPLGRLLGQHLAAVVPGRESAARGWPRPRPRGWPWETRRWCSGPCSRDRWDGSASRRLKRSPPAKLDGPIGDHLVGVHVAGGARAGLKDIDGKLVVESSVGHFAAGGEQGLDLGVQSSGFLPEPVSLPRSRLADGGRPFHQAQGMDQLRRQGPAGDGEVLHGPLGLGPVVGRRRAGGPRPSNRARCGIQSLAGLSLAQATNAYRSHSQMLGNGCVQVSGGIGLSYGFPGS